MLKHLTILSCIAVAVSMCGCGNNNDRRVRDRDDDRRYYDRDDDDFEYDDDFDDDDYEDVVIEQRHICTDACHNHFYNGNRVVVIRGHRHGPNCGHRFSGRYWIRGQRPRRASVRHVCTRNCHNHVFRGGRLVTIRGHQHDRRCGHIWNGQYWVAGRGRGVNRQTTVIRKRNTHVCSRNCDNHYFDGNRVITLDNHRHGRNCGHVWDGDYWIVANDGTRVYDKRSRRR